MSEYGLRTWDDKGKMDVSVNHKLTRKRYHSIVSSDDGTTLSDIAGRSTALFSMMINGTEKNSTGYGISRSGINVSWYDPNNAGNRVSILKNSIIYVFIYD